MKRAMLVVLLVLAMATTASAYIITVGDRLDYKGQTAYSMGQGGEFKFEVFKNLGTTANPYYGATSSFDLYTFCAQVGQYIKPTMYVTHIDGARNSTGLTLTDFAEYVYWGYTTDQEGGNVVPTRLVGAVDPSAPVNNINSNTDGGTIQWTIWDELGYTFPTGGLAVTPPDPTLYSSWVTQYVTDNAPGGAWYDEKASPFGLDPVAIAWTSDNINDVKNGTWGDEQDQLVIVPGGLPDVPEPTSLAIWAMVGGLGAAGAAFRRRRQNGRTAWSEENRQGIMSIIQGGR